MSLSFGQKLLAGLFGVQFVAGFAKEVVRIGATPLTEAQWDFVTNAIVNSSVYQSLIRDGNSVKDVSRILDIRHMSPQKFYQITGFNWPVK